MKKIIERYLLKGLLIFLIILAGCIPIVVAAYQTIEKQVIETADLKLQEGIQKIDHHLEQMIQIEQNVKQDDSFEVINRTAGQLPAENYLDLSKANQYFKDIGIGYSFSPYLFAMFKKNDVIVSSAQCSGDFSGSYYGSLLEIQDNGKICKAEEVKEKILNQDSFYSFWVTDQTTFWEETSMLHVDGAILCSVMGNGKNSLKTSYVMVFLLDPKEIVEEILMGQMGEESIVKIVDSNGQLLIRQGEDLSEEMETGQVKLASGTYQLLSQSAPGMGWKIQIGIPQEIITKQVKDLIELILLYVAMGVTLLLIAVLVLIYKQYSSVRKLLLLCPAEGEGWKKNKNEYEILANVMTKMRENADQFREKMEQIKEQNETILMENFIVRGIATQEDKKVLEERWSPFPEFYCFALVQVREEEQVNSMAVLFVEKALRETVKKRVISIPMGTGEAMFILEMKPDEIPSTKPVLEVFHQISRLLLHEQGIVVRIGISTIATKMDNLPVCYRQARQILRAYNQENQRMVEGYSQDWKLRGNQLTGLDWMQKILVLISCGERQEFHIQMKRWVEMCRKSPMAFENQKPQIFFALRNVLSDAYESAGIPMEEEGLPQYTQDDSPESMAVKFMDMATVVMKRMDEKKRSKNRQLKEKILTYLEDHFHEEGMTAYRICDQMGISEKYLIQFVKEQTGESFTTFLEKRRMERAKEYLCTTDWSNEVIAQRCGFGAVNTFYRVFRKNTGMSPGTYRKEQVESYHLGVEKEK